MDSSDLGMPWPAEPEKHPFNIAAILLETSEKMSQVSSLHMHGDVRLLAGKSNPSWKIVWKCLKSEASFLIPKMASRTRKLPWHLLAINICMPSPDQHWIKHLDFWNPKIWENMPDQNYDKLVIMPVGAAWVFRWWMDQNGCHQLGSFKPFTHLSGQNKCNASSKNAYSNTE